MASEKLTLKKYQALVQERGQQVLDVMAAIATGKLENIHVDIPPGDDILGDIAIGLSFIVDDFRSLLNAQEEARQALELKVAERTAELETALAELQTAQRRYTSQAWQAYLQEGEQEEQVVELAPELTPAIAQAVAQNQPTTYHNGHSALAVPISYGDEVIGVLGFSGEAELHWGEDELAAVAAIAEQVGLALENQRLFDQTQTALNESETLYNFSAWLNVANTLEEILQAIASVSGAENGILFQLEGDAQRPPAEMTPIANWNTSGRSGTPLHVTSPLSPVMQLVVQKPTEPRLFGNIAHDPEFPEVARAGYANMNIASVVWLPLFLNDRWLGAVAISWPNDRLFGEVDKRVYQAMMGQTAVALNQYLLAQEIRQRAENLAKLAEIEGNLSQTSNAEGLVAALAEGLNDPTLVISIHRLELDKHKQPVAQIPIAIWAEGGLNGQDARLHRPIPMNALSTARYWLTNPTQLFHVDDVEDDPRVDEVTREMYAQLHVRSTTVIPLRSGGMWQGIVAITCPNPYKLSAQQTFILESLQDSLSALVASQQAQAAQREALAETELLYNASVGFNRAETVDEVLRVIVETLEGTGAVSATMWDLEVEASTNTPITQTLTAAWRFDGGPSRMPLGTSMNLREYPISKVWYERPQQVTLIGDVQTDPMLDEEPSVRQLLQAIGVRAQAFLPLTLGSRWVGLVSIQWDSTYQFDAKDERLYTTLAAQAATSIDSLALLEETRQQAEQLQTLAAVETAFSKAETEQDLLQALAHYLPGIDHLLLSFIDSGADNLPVLFVPAAEMIDGNALAELQMAPLNIREYPSSMAWISKPNTLFIVEELVSDNRVDERLKAGFTALSWQSYVLIPLFTGGRWQGAIVLAWRTPHTPTKQERFVLEQVMEPLAAVVASRRAFIEQQRAEAALRASSEQLEKLAVIQQQLSAAVTENDILQAVLGAADDLGNIAGMTLGYIYESHDGTPHEIEIVAAWQDGGVLTRDQSIVGQKFELAYWPSSVKWINNPTQLFHIEDVNNNEDVEEFARQIYLQSNVFGVTSIPLRSGGRWQANLSYSWNTAHPLSASEQFIMERLLESMGTTIASRRAFLAQQQAQQETERLYNASRRINEAAGDVSEIVAALGQLDPNLKFNRGVFWLFEYGQGEITHMRVEGSWYSGHGRYPTPTGTRYGRDKFMEMVYLFTQTPLFFDHVNQHTELQAEVLAELDEAEVRTLVVLPLWAGTRQVGTILLKGPEPQAFSEADTRPYISLLPQVAVAVENKLLLEQTSQRARREQILREVTEKVRSSTDVNTILKTATAEIGRALGRKAFITIDTTKR